MKKLVLAASAIAILLGFSSCNQGGTKSSNSSIDTLSAALGFLQGGMMSQNIMIGEMQGVKMDKEQFLKGFKENFGDTAKFSYLAGAITAVQMSGELLKEGVDKKLFLNYYEQSLLKDPNTSDSVLMSKMPIPLTMEEARSFTDNYYRMKMIRENEEKFGKNKKEGEEAIAKFLKEEGVQKTETGIAYKYLEKGNGKSPKLEDMVNATYKGTLIDGTKFDESETGVDFLTSEVIPGWKELLQLMKEGDRIRAYIPYEMAYGENGAGEKIPPFSTLVFEIKLNKVMPAKK